MPEKICNISYQVNIISSYRPALATLLTFGHEVKCEVSTLVDNWQTFPCVHIMYSPHCGNASKRKQNYRTWELAACNAKFPLRKSGFKKQIRFALLYEQSLFSSHFFDSRD